MELDASIIESRLNQIKLLFRQETESTNSLAKQLGLKNPDDLPFVVVAQNQTAGRGQTGKTWWSDSGSITFSVVAKATTTHPPNMVALHTAILVAREIEFLTNDIRVDLKWPNDLFLNDRKFGGILIESFSMQQSRGLVIGIGLNISSDLSNASTEIQSVATSVKSSSGCEIDPNELLPNICNAIQTAFLKPDLDAKSVTEEFQSRLIFPVGTQLTVEQRDGLEFSGEFAGIGENAELIIRDNSEIRKFVSATITDCRAR